MAERRGRIVSTTRRPPVPFDIFSCPISTSSTDEELNLTDGVFSNYNGRSIPSAALKTLLKSPKLAEEGADADIDAGRVSGLIFVSERDDGLETLYIALRFNVDNRVKVFALADIFGAADFGGMRLEDSGCIGGGYSVGSRTVDHCLIHVSTKEPMQKYRTPWTAVYKTNLSTGKTERLTPQGVFDLNPAVSPSGRMVAVASSEGKSWNGEMENVQTDIYMMNVDSEEGQGQGRKLLIKNGGWPSWGSDDMIFFHRWGVFARAWGVLRYKISTGQTFRVTTSPDAMTPAAISETKVAVATICGHYRHIKIIDTDKPWLQRVRIDITHKLTPNVHHYSPFVLDGGCRIGYHRCRSESDLVQHGDHVPRILHRLESPMKDVGLFRVSGMFPTISKDGSKLAFVDKKLTEVWVADNQGRRMVHEMSGSNCVFSSPVWNQNPDKDILYVCIGSSSVVQMPVEIYAIHNASGAAVQRQVRRLTYGGFNNAFPSSSPEGNKLVFQSTRDFVPERGSSQPTSNWQKLMFWRTRKIDARKKHKNLYIMLKTDVRGSQEGWVTRLTKGPWTDTQCQWSPSGDWIAFSSTRDKPARPGYLSVFLVKAHDPTVVIKLITSYGGHVEYPVFSPDGRSIAVTMDLVAVSADPVSLPMSTGTARPYRGIFTVDIDPHDKTMKSKDVEYCRRITHSRYECSMLAWTSVPTDPDAKWNIMLTTQGFLVYR